MLLHVIVPDGIDRQESLRAQFKGEMAQALREQYRTDAAGRRYRAKHAVRHTFAGKQLSFWGDNYMEIAFAQKRRRIAGELHQLKLDVDHFNESRPDEKPIQLSLNFEDDVLERLVDGAMQEFG